MRFLGFFQKFYPFRYSFLHQYKSTNSLLTFCKSNVFGKIWFLRYCPKTSRPIRMQDSLSHKYPTNKLRYIGIYDFEFLKVTRVPLK